MPWTTKDVEKHKKGLTTKQKKQWVAIANSVHTKCMSDGGGDSTCAVSAIKQANGATMMNSIPTYENINTDYEIRKATYHNESYLVVPVVMMVEGVHHGSQGPLLHKISDLGMFPASWNGIPIVIDHPEVDGFSVSANSPEILDDVMVGRVFNTHVDGTKLMAEAWLRETKLVQDYSKILSELNDKKPIEVSVGVFTENEDTEGDYKGEHYEAIARNHRPDHLALLPGGTGACSVEDGCGIRTNKRKGGKESMKDSKFVVPFKDLNANGYSVSKIGVNVDQGFMERINDVREVINEMDTENAYHYLEEVFNDYVIYCTRLRNVQTGSFGDDQMYKQSYSIDAEGDIALTGDATPVDKQISYVPSTNNNSLKRTKINNNKGGNTMADEKKPCGQCMEKVVTIINSNKTHFTADDREWLLTQDEAVLDKLLPKEPEKSVVVANTEVKVPEITREQILQALSAEDRAAMAFGQKQLKAIRENQISVIQANTSKEIWPDATLNAMEDDTLERLFKSVKKEENEVVDYSFGASQRSISNNAEADGLWPTGIEVK
jgi:hypothetical protein